jgi:hypothetical protein
VLKFTEHIVKVGDKYRLLSHKGKNLGTFDSHSAAAKHEGEVEYFKAHESANIDTELSEGKGKGCQYCGGPIAGYTCTKCGRVQGRNEETEMCIYCSHEPQDPKFAPYCSFQCSMNAENDNAMDEDTIQDTIVGDKGPLPVKAESDDEGAGSVLESVRSLLKEGANDPQEKKFTAVCTKYGFTLNAEKTKRNIPNQFSPSHMLDDLVFEKHQGTDEHGTERVHTVLVTLYYAKLGTYGDKSWGFKYHQTNGIKGPYGSGDTSGQLDKTLARMESDGRFKLNEDWVPPSAGELERMVLKAMPRTKSISADQMAEKLSMRMAWMGTDGMERLRLEVSYALAGLADRSLVRRVNDGMGKGRFVRANLMGESTTEVSAGDLGFKPIKGKNQNFAYPESLSYGGRSWTKQTSGGEHWEAKDKLAAIKYADRYGNILKVTNSLAEDFSVTRCECPDDSVDHDANDCQNDATYKVERELRTLYLCGDCVFSSDRTERINSNDEHLDEAVTRYTHECTSCNKAYAPNLNECPSCGSNRTKDTMETVDFYPGDGQGSDLQEDSIEDKPSMTIPDSEKDKEAALDKAAPKDDAMPEKKLTEAYYMIHYTDGSSEKFEGSASQARAKAAKSSKQIDDIETLSQSEYTAESLSVKRFGRFLKEDGGRWFSTLERAKLAAQEESKAGYVVHIEPAHDGYRISDWYDSETTVASYENGKALNEANEPNRLCSVCKDPATWHHVGRDLDYCDKCAPQHAMQKLVNNKLTK